MRRALWLIPPLLGVAFYAAGSAVAGRAVPPVVARAQRLANRSVMDRLPQAGTELSPEEIEQAVSDIATAEREKIATASPAELKGMILKLVKEVEEVKRGLRSYDWDQLNFLHGAARRLGTLERGGALAWMMEHAPEKREPFMDGWADEDAAGAFEAVVGSTVMKPCSEATLMKMLSDFADQSPQRLRDACLRTPWGLFNASDSFSDEPGILLMGSSVRPWIESGVLLELRDRGVNVAPVFYRWMSEDPAGALAEWKAGRGPSTGPEKSLLGMLYPGNRSEEERAAIRAGIDDLMPEDRERIVRILTEEVRAHSYDDEWREAYPGLIPADAAKKEGNE